jgi:hypothetical protein
MQTVSLLAAFSWSTTLVPIASPTLAFGSNAVMSSLVSV